MEANPERRGIIKKMYSGGEYYFQYHPHPYDPFVWRTISREEAAIRFLVHESEFEFVEHGVQPPPND